MRRAVALGGCLALLAALTLAPFQHVHHGHGDHDHSSFIHAHFYTEVAEPDHDDDGPEIEDHHDPHSAAPLDTFTIVPSAIFALALPAKIASSIPEPPLSSTDVRVVEERGHDPPILSPSSPRAPPV